MKKILLILMLLISCETSQAAPWKFGWQVSGKGWLGEVRAPATLTNFKYTQWDNLVMTSSNTPAPANVKADSIFSADFNGWYAFDNNASATNRWASTGSDSYPHYLLYDCGTGNSNVIRTFIICNDIYPDFSYNAFIVQGSNDGITYSNLYSGNLANTKYIFQYFDITNSTSYRYYKLYGSSGVNASWAQAEYVHYSSAKLIKPIMTNSNAPSPYVVTSSHNATTNAWGVEYAFHCFDGSDWQTGTTPNTRWATTTTNYPCWIKIDMGSNIVLNGFTYVSGSGYGFKDITISASPNDAIYTTLINTNLNDTPADTVSSSYQHIPTQNTTAYRYYMFSTTNAYNKGLATITTSEILLWQYEVQ